MRWQVEALLEADTDGAARLDDGAARMSPRLLENGDVARDRWIGRELGPYRITRALASGGMGEIFLGERSDGQFEQRVAVADHLVREGSQVERSGRRGAESATANARTRYGAAELQAPRLPLSKSSLKRDESATHV